MRRSVALSVGRSEKESGLGRAERTEEERSVWESERRLRREVTMWVGGGCGGGQRMERQKDMK